MKLNNELFELGKSSKTVFTPIDKDYCLVTKSMPVDDGELVKYIKDINDANEAGLNVTRVLDYRLIDGSTKSYYEGKYNYTKGVFLEDRAQGNTLEYGTINISTTEDCNIDEIGFDYLSKVKFYIEELERRAVAPQEMYDKLVGDCLAVEDYDLMIDPRPTNFFFDSERGFTIIDVLSNNNGTKTASDKLVQLVFGIVYGYGSYDLMINNNSFEVLPQDYLTRLVAVYKKIDKKILEALVRFYYDEEDILDTIENLIIRYGSGYGIVSNEEEFMQLLNLEFNSVKDGEVPVYKM